MFSKSLVFQCFPVLVVDSVLEYLNLLLLIQAPYKALVLIGLVLAQSCFSVLILLS